MAAFLIRPIYVDMIALIKLEQLCISLLDPFRDFISWLRPSESRRFVFADERCCVLIIVREKEEYVVVMTDNVVEWDCVG